MPEQTHLNRALRTSLSVVCTSLVLVMPLSLAQQEPTPAADSANSADEGVKKAGIRATSGMRGTVVGNGDRKLRGVRLVFAPLGSSTPVMESVSKKGGRFEVAWLEYGYYSLACEYDGQVYQALSPVRFEPENVKVRRIKLRPHQLSDERLGISASAPVDLLGGRQAVGVCEVEDELDPTGEQWFQTGKGVATIIASATLVTAALIVYGDSDDDVETTISPISP